MTDSQKDHEKKETSNMETMRTMPTTRVVEIDNTWINIDQIVAVRPDYGSAQGGTQILMGGRAYHHVRRNATEHGHQHHRDHQLGGRLRTERTHTLTYTARLRPVNI